MVNDIVKAKGLKGFNNKKNLLELFKEGEYISMKFAKVKESLRRKDDIKVNQKMTVVKSVSFEDTKRVWALDKFDKDILQNSRPWNSWDYNDGEEYELY